MIEAYELRIGNKLLFEENGTFAKVLEIDQLGVKVLIGEEITWIELGAFGGIAINETQLEALGLDSGRVGYYVFGAGLVISVEGQVYNDDQWLCELDHIHELQNLAFALLKYDI